MRRLRQSCRQRAPMAWVPWSFRKTRGKTPICTDGTDSRYLSQELSCTSLKSGVLSMILAGDVGGTKVHLALYDFECGRLKPVRDEKFPAPEFATLDAVVETFLTGE